MQRHVIARDESRFIPTIRASFGQVLLTTFRTVIGAIDGRNQAKCIAFCKEYKKAVPILSNSYSHPNNLSSPNMVAPNISTKDLTFAFPDGTSGLEHVTLDLPAGSRNLLIGGKDL
jgi:hypothetical protein